MSERTNKAFEKGKRAYLAGRSLGQNPYTHETTIQSANFRAWVHGWRTAVENDPLTERDEKNTLLNVSE